MKSPGNRPLSDSRPLDDPSIAVLRRIARRADALRRNGGSGHQRGDLECWLQAEREIFESDGVVFQRV